MSDNDWLDGEAIKINGSGALAIKFQNQTLSISPDGYGEQNAQLSLGEQVKFSLVAKGEEGFDPNQKTVANVKGITF